MGWLKSEWSLFELRGLGWIEVALLVCLFWAALFRPERVSSWLKFRLSAVLLTAAIGAHGLIRIFVFGFWMSEDDRKMTQLNEAIWLIISFAFPSFLTMFAFLLGIASIIPRSSRRDGGKSDA
jgi:hypothetical protein